MDQLPPEMLAAKRWLVWRQEHGRKVPYYASGVRRHGTLDSPEDIACFADFQTALAALQRDPSFSGLGFALGPDGEGRWWQGIDLDDIAQKGLQPLADRLPGYVEVTPSGDGHHAIGRGARFMNREQEGGDGQEAYCYQRFFTVTGNAVRCPDGPLPDLTPRLQAEGLWQPYVPKAPKEIAVPAVDYQGFEKTHDANRRERYLQAIRNAPNGNRNPCINVNGHWLGRLVAGGRLEPEATLEALKEAALEVGDNEAGDLDVVARSWESGLKKPLPEWLEAEDRLGASDMAKEAEATAHRMLQECLARAGSEAAAAPSVEPQLLPCIWFNDAEPVLAANDFVEGLLTSASMSVIYGPSNCGKTFFILDLALHVAWGRQWRGKEVDKGAIVYLSLEGAQGIRNRMAAFRKHNEISEKLPFVAMPKPVDLLGNDADVEAVIQLVRHVADATNVPVRMVVVDTLSRAMAGGNENSPEDMTALIGNCDRIRAATESHVCIVHHSGKDEARGARGHSSLRAATDTEIEIKRAPNLPLSTAKVTKQRDLEADGPLNFTLHSVALGVNGRGKLVTSCVVGEANAAVEPGLTPKLTQVLSVLHDLQTGRNDNLGGVLKADFKEGLLEAGIFNRNNPESARKGVADAIKALTEKGKISVEGDMIKPIGM